jgi:hypothetical protein
LGQAGAIPFFQQLLLLVVAVVEVGTTEQFQQIELAQAEVLAADQGRQAALHRLWAAAGIRHQHHPHKGIMAETRLPLKHTQAVAAVVQVLLAEMHQAQTVELLAQAAQALPLQSPALP